jgi:hypothetical protein
MRLAMWTYPWDVLDLGADTVAADLASRAGLNAVSLAAAYHAGHFLQARSPRRKSYFPEDGVIYFRPDPARWVGRRILPKVADLLGQSDALRDLIRRRDAGGLKVHCWTVCLHNTRLGMLHPEVCTRNAFGDPNYFSLCPNNGDARSYAVTMVADLTHNYRPDSVELESPGFMGFVHGYHHEKDGVGLSDDEVFLMSLCFCPACIARAKTAGLDGEAVRGLVHRLLIEVTERPLPAREEAEVARYPEIEAYAELRVSAVTALVAEAKEAAHPDTRVHVIDDLAPMLTGHDTGAAARSCDGALVCAYNMDTHAVATAIADARRAIGADRWLGAGLRVFVPEIGGAADLVARAEAAVRAGAKGLNFYNYGLVPAARLDWIAEASRAARAAASAHRSS